jgi:rhodanese-related sulfurtransferase
MKKNFSIVVIGIMFGACGAQNNMPDNKSNNSQVVEGQICERIDAKKFRQGISQGNVQILDVRTPEEFNTGKIDGAVNINFYDADFKQQVASKLDISVPVYLYCRSGGRSQQAMQILKELGFSVVYELEGGYMNYNK